MSLDIYLRLRAARARRARPRATRRHAHLVDRPLVVVGYHLAGDPGAPVALRYGTAPETGRTVVVGEPRDRTLRFARLAVFAADLLRYLALSAGRAIEARTVRGRPQTESLCPDAPQLVCPNPSTAAWLTDTLGRSLRFLRPGGEYPVDPGLPVAGAHLTFFAGQRVLPGSCLVLAATDLLTTHWVTGQTPAEDADLGTVLSWVDPPVGSDGPAAALAAEARPPAGPVSDPGWDRDVLQPLIGEYGRVRADEVPQEQAEIELAAACCDALRTPWQDCWAALDLMRALPEAAHVGERWRADRRAWTAHLERVATGTAYFRRRLDELQSLRFLYELERRTVALARQMALDDPLLMAAQVAAGDALTGELAGRDCQHRVAGARGRALLRPVLRLRPAVRFDRPAGTELWWAADPGVRVEVTSVDGDGTVALRVVAGACQSAARAERILPAVGARMTFVGFDDQRFPDRLPEQLPWTHAPAREEP